MFLIDGNNLWHAAMERSHPLAGISRSDLLTLLDEFARATGEPITVVLDGPGRSHEPEEGGGTRRLYAGPRPADAVIEQMVADSTDPRRLIIVSSDRELLRQVRKRRVRVVAAEAFARRLEGWCHRPRSPDRGEPAAKQGGLGGSADSIDDWVRYFQLYSDPEPGDIMTGDRVEGGPDDDAGPGESPQQSADGAPADRMDADLGRAFRDVTPLKEKGRRTGPQGKKPRADTGQGEPS